ncbi:MAG: hypothetical protein KBG21_00440 [Ignavibacteria bacterium]|jgi:hypothetical protein|nr:hypothetical protein [Ignavibacteria bacterium]
MPAVKKILVLVSIFFYLISLFSPAYIGLQSDNSWNGFMCLGFGWMALVWNPIGFFAWLANFPYFVNVVMVLISKKIWSRIATSIIGAVSLFLALGAFDVTYLMRDEGGNTELADYGAGLYLWIFSMIIMVVAAALPGEKKPVEVHYINNPNPIK